MATVHRNEEARKERARNIGLLNGLAMVLVELPAAAVLEVHFINDNEIAAILAEIAATPDRIRDIFRIEGGHRLPAGSKPGQVQVTGVAQGPAPNIVMLDVAPIGDYSTYTLILDYQHIDPVFRQIGFRFRPGCFTNDCAPVRDGSPVDAEIAIDYATRDFDSFRHTLITAMMARVPGWVPSSEADLDQVLIELLSAAGDELADFQDRVMNEAYLGTARKRVSLARHSRLVDYHIHEGNQASTWVAFKVRNGTGDTIKKPGLRVWTGMTEIPPDTGVPGPGANSQVFLTRNAFHVHPLFDKIGLYSWSDTVTQLDAGTTCADLQFRTTSKQDADDAVSMIVNGQHSRLLLQEWKDPLTCRRAGADPRKRQLLTLDPQSAAVVHDPDPTDPGNPNHGNYLVHVCWEEPLENTYCFRAACPDGLPDASDISLFHGNLAQVFHGMPWHHEFLPPGAIIDPAKSQSHYALPATDACTDSASGSGESVPVFHHGIRCPLPDIGLPLLYQNTPPGGEHPVQSTLTFGIGAGDQLEEWKEQPTLVFSEGTDPHFRLETSEYGKSVICLGNGINGKPAPDNAAFSCDYQVGSPLAGNIGRDAVADLDRLLAPGVFDDAELWNPFDVTDGRAPEAPEIIIRRAPEAWRNRQLRAITLDDYVNRASEVKGVSRVAARYGWTGSWRTVQITIDPLGTTLLTPDLRDRVYHHLTPVRLIGEDLEIRSPRYVPLDIVVTLCIDAKAWPGDVRFDLEAELSDSYTPDGRLGFFHPDRWTFGQELHASEVTGRIQAIPGVDHIVSISMRRWGAATPGTDAIVAIAANEIISVRNDPDHMEQGMVRLDLQGGRR